ncbi:MAG: ABC transporter substrate-binding protein [Oscillospiraceae bacterium]|nr:ABC transporter substrate-binding protein [Oscillospiraceae bacterium]
MRRLFTVLAAMLLLTACAPGGGDASSSIPTASASVEQSIPGTCTFTDSMGNTVELEQPPKRVAALLGSYAETWLLAGGEVVAVTQDAYDERGLELPEDTVNLGANQQPDLEALFAAEPDLVLLTPDLDGQMALRDSLEAAKIPAAWFKVETFDDYLTMLKICTDLTGRSDLYQKNGLDIQRDIDAAIASVPEGEAPTVLLLRAYSSGVRAKNSDNIAGAILKDLGAANIADSESGLLEDLQMESILAADPEFIFVTTMGASQEAALKSLDELLHSDPAWQTLTAVKEGRVEVLPKDLFHYKPNARWGESYQMLAGLMYGSGETA